MEKRRPSVSYKEVWRRKKAIDYSLSRSRSTHRERHPLRSDDGFKGQPVEYWKVYARIVVFQHILTSFVRQDPSFPLGGKKREKTQTFGKPFLTRRFPEVCIHWAVASSPLSPRTVLLFLTQTRTVQGCKSPFGVFGDFISTWREKPKGIEGLESSGHSLNRRD